MFTVFTLREFIAAVVGGTFALGPLVYELFAYFNLFPNLGTAAKRAVIGVTCAILGVGVWGLGVWLGYVPQPADPTAIAEAIWANGVNLGLAAFLSATVLHGIVMPTESAPVEGS